MLLRSLVCLLAVDVQKTRNSISQDLYLLRRQQIRNVAKRYRFAPQSDFERRIREEAATDYLACLLFREKKSWDHASANDPGSVPSCARWRKRNFFENKRIGRRSANAIDKLLAFFT